MPKLALKGGNPLRVREFPLWPEYDEKEMEALGRVLKSGKWGAGGTEVSKFEERFARYNRSKYSVAVTNGTVTLEIILRALGIGPGDEVIIPPYTFIATASAVLMIGATPVFADIENDTYNIDHTKIEEAVTPRTKAVIPVHIGGRMCDMDSILDIAGKYNLYVVEDSAHAHGSEWKGKRAGSIGHAGSFSFQSSKNLTSGEGGMITTAHAGLYEACWSISHCGRAAKNPVWYEHPNLGTNARMTEFQAALLDAQMDRLDGQIDKRMKNAAYLTSRLKEIPCIEVFKEDNRVTRNTYHLFVCKFKSEKCKGLTKDMFLSALTAEGINCSSGYVCLYKQPVFSDDRIVKLTVRETAYKDMYLENAEDACYKEGFWFTQNMMLGEKTDMDDIADAIIKIYENTDEILQVRRQM